MSLADVTSETVAFVADVLVNDCGRPEPDRMLTYHGVLPHDCCTEDGLLVASWSSLVLTTAFPSSGGPAAPCAGTLAATIAVRYVVCWKVPEVSESGVVLEDTYWNATAMMLADVADCVTRAFARLQCAPPEPESPGALLIAATGRDRLRFVEASPIAVSGGCAGVQFRLNAGSHAPVVIS